jgi:hypothetical protein
MQLDAVERRLFDGPEAAISAPRRFRGGEFPLVGLNGFAEGERGIADWNS